jgi:nucleoside-diphosphate-sugar epimerase
VAGPPGTYNVASGAEHTMRALAELIAARIGPDAPALLDVGALPYRANEQMRYVLDATRAARVLGWRAAIPLAAGLDEVIAAHR